MNKHKKALIKILLAFAVLMLGVLLPVEGIYSLGIFLISYVIIGSEIVLRAVRNIFHGQVFDENFLMTIATIGAFFVGDYAEGVAVMLFYQVGELFQSYAVNQSRKSISALMEICPDSANVKRNGVIESVDPEEVSVGEFIVVKPGERVPLDGRLVEGKSALDTSALTGEALPREVFTGDDIISGCINIHGILTIEVSKEFGDSTVAKILDLVENASSKKAQAENFITKFARYYTPIVVVAAVILAIVPPLLIPGALFQDWIYRALQFLVVSCPCALVISIPLGFFGGIGGASRRGILVKGSNYLELLASAETVVFDKTGTLTKGSFALTEIRSAGMPEDQLLELAAKAESFSNHPISMSIRQAWEKRKEELECTDAYQEAAVSETEAEHLNIEELAGFGVRTTVNGKLVLAGNAKLMERENVSFTLCESIGTIVYLAVDQVFAGALVIADELKEDAARAILELKKTGVKKTVMLTGDADKVGRKVAKELNLDEVYTELLPADKVDRLEELLKQKTSKGKLVFVGDGMNDAPVLARADIGIAMGGLGSDAAIEAADIVIMTDEPSKIATAIGISRKTLTIVKQNIVFAFVVKAIVLVMSALGFSTMWEAVFADVGVSIIAILNAVRALNYKDE